MTFREYHEKQQLLMEEPIRQINKKGEYILKIINGKSKGNLKSEFNSFKDLIGNNKSKINDKTIDISNEILSSLQKKGKEKDVGEDLIRQLNSLLITKEVTTNAPAEIQKEIKQEVEEKEKVKEKENSEEVKDGSSEEEVKDGSSEEEVKDGSSEEEVKGGSSEEEKEKEKENSEEVKDISTDYQWLYDNMQNDISKAVSKLKNSRSPLADVPKDTLYPFLISEIIFKKNIQYDGEKETKIDGNYSRPAIKSKDGKSEAELYITKANKGLKYSITRSENDSSFAASIKSFIDNINELHISRASNRFISDCVSQYVQEMSSYDVDEQSGTLKNKILNDIKTKKIWNDNVTFGKHSEDETFKDANGNIWTKTKDGKYKFGDEEKDLEEIKDIKPSGGSLLIGNNDDPKKNNPDDNNKKGRYISVAQKRSDPNLIRCADLRIIDTKDDEGRERIENAIRNTFGDINPGSDGNPINGMVFDSNMERLAKRMQELQSSEKEADARRQKTEDESSRKQYDSVKTESYSPVFKELNTNPLLKEQKEILSELYFGKPIFGRISRNSEYANENWKKEMGDEGGLRKCQGNFLSKAMKQFKELTDETNSQLGLSSALNKLKKLEADYIYEMQRRTTDIIKSNNYNLLGQIVQAGKNAKENITKDLDKSFDNSRYGAMRKYEEPEVLKAINDNLMKFIEKGGEEATVISYASKNPAITKDPVVVNNGYEKIITNILIKNFYPKLKDRNDLVIHILKKINEIALKMFKDENTDSNNKALIKSFFDKGTDKFFEDAIKKLNPGTKQDEKGKKDETNNTKVNSTSNNNDLSNRINDPKQNATNLANEILNLEDSDPNKKKYATEMYVNFFRKSSNGGTFWKGGNPVGNLQGRLKGNFVSSKFSQKLLEAMKNGKTEDISLELGDGRVCNVVNGLVKGISKGNGTEPNNTEKVNVTKENVVQQNNKDTTNSDQNTTKENTPSDTKENNPEEIKKKKSILDFFNNLKKSALTKRVSKLEKKASETNNLKDIEKWSKADDKLKNMASILTFEDNFLVCVPLLEDDQPDQEVQVRTADAEKAILMALSVDQQTSAQGKKWIVDNMYKGNPEAEKLVDEFIKNNTKDRAKADQALRGNQKVAPGPGGNPTGQQPQQNGQQPNVNQPQQQAQPNPNGQQQPAVTNPAAPAMPQQAMANQQQPNPNGAPQQATVTTGAADGYPNRLYKKLIRRKIGM